MRIVDTSGQQCPAPLIATKRALKEAQTGESFQIITDSKTSFSNISRFLIDNSTEFSFDESNGIWILTVTKSTAEAKARNPEEYCSPGIPHFSRGDFIVSFTSDKMGEGAEELGHQLMNNFIKAIKDLDILPASMVFYNRGVFLGSVDSACAGHLRELERMGVTLLFCATCAKYYAIEDRIRIGTLSNMYEIARVMATASSILKP